MYKDTRTKTQKFVSAWFDVIETDRRPRWFFWPIRFVFFVPAFLYLMVLDLFGIKFFYPNHPATREDEDD